MKCIVHGVPESLGLLLSAFLVYIMLVIFV